MARLALCFQRTTMPPKSKQRFASTMILSHGSTRTRSCPPFYKSKQQRFASTMILSHGSTKTSSCPPFYTVNSLHARDEKMSSFNLVQNHRAVELVNFLITDCQVRPTDISVITPYRSNLDLVKSELPPGVQANTVDGIQGRETNYVVLVLVVDKSSGPEFVAGPNRIYISITRHIKNLFLRRHQHYPGGYTAQRDYPSCLAGLRVKQASPFSVAPMILPHTAVFPGPLESLTDGRNPCAMFQVYCVSLSSRLHSQGF
ncbi:hypothetical protein QBC43DRAFT_12750 [Cladorrhinum sp. PSN259]|nr:hypothetical protein QBC43DRAFT_12750 [Cladorrhinum sp. PSN259]